MTIALTIAISAFLAADVRPPEPEYAAASPALSAGNTLIVSGNGGLTVYVTAYGQVTACQWPSPSYYNQLRVQSLSPRNDTSAGQRGGLMWGLRIKDRTLWLAGQPWETSTRYLTHTPNVAETLLTLPGTGLVAKHALFVCPDKNVLVSHLSAYGTGDLTQVYWYAGFSPCTLLVPELPTAGWAPESISDFASFADTESGTIYHFRPKDPGKSDWEHVRRLAANSPSASEWSSFSDGVWIGYRGIESPSEYHCGEKSEASSALRQADAGELAGQRSAMGQCDSALLWNVRRSGAPEFSVTVLVGFGKNVAEVRSALDSAAAAKYESLLQNNRKHWTTWLEQARLPSQADPELIELGKQCLVVLANARDRESGAVVSASPTQAPFVFDRAKEGAWITLAFDLAGYSELAEKHTLFYIECLRKTSGPGKPAGSLPAAMYANHVDGLPHLILDVEASAWMVWSFWRHAESLDQNARLEYLKKVWAATDLAGDFLTGWVDERSGEPLPFFVNALWRDGRTDAQLAGIVGGIGAALHIAQYLGYDRPEWTERMRQMKAAAQYHFLDAAQNWKIENPLSYWPAEIIPLDDTRWDAPIAAALKTLSTLEGDRAIFAVSDLAMVCKARLEWLERLRPIAVAALRRALSQAPVTDRNPPLYSAPVTAARCLVAIESLYSN